MPDIFLSYTREDQTAAHRFAEAFEAQGFSVWWDASLRSGEAYDQVTEEALRTAHAVVVLWSPKSVMSRWVRAEATLADRQHTLIPARIETCDLPIMFELTQTADLSRWSGAAGDPAWLAFLADVRRFVEAGAAQQRPAQRPAPASRAARYSARPSIAILPFINRSGLQEDDQFAEAMVEDLSAALAAYPLMSVVAARATMAFRTGSRDLRQIGRDLAVRYLLEGNVRRAGQNVRVTAQLVEAENDNILWTKKFDRPLVELSALQDDLVSEVAAHLTVQVQRAEMEHAQKKSEGLTAWEAVKRSQLYSSFGTPSGRDGAVAEARRAVELDPSDATAHGWLASYQGHLLHNRGGGDAELAREVACHIAQARALDPHNPEVLSGIALALAWMRKPHEALPLAQRAVAASPNIEGNRFALGAVLARLGRCDEAVAELDAVERLAPDGTMAHFAWKWRSIAFLQAGRLEEALQSATRALHLVSDGDSLLQHALCLAKLGDWESACEAIRRLRETHPDVSRALAADLVRGLYSASAEVEDHAELVLRLWDDAAGGQA